MMIHVRECMNQGWGRLRPLKFWQRVKRIKLIKAFRDGNIHGILWAIRDVEAALKEFAFVIGFVVERCEVQGGF